jgi:3'-phosphoadenosine 5'-phosphosulfate sulfotransferase (PAPS reductase)/FAD synthetase
MNRTEWTAENVNDIQEEINVMRIKQLEEQAMTALQLTVGSGQRVVFPNALIAGDVVITHLLSRMNLLQKVPVLVVNTLHLFEETLDFVEDMEKEYGFKSYQTMAKGVTGDRVESKENFDKIYGADLWQQDISKYDDVCKVEPFRRGLSDLGAEIIITGRTRW